MLKIHEKKIILLNSAGYYDDLIAHLNRTKAEGFLHEDWQLRITILTDPESIFS
jgi:predicted Rossmann-fold nucleotide-binding protein